jgi:hypothetical protein
MKIVSAILAIVLTGCNAQRKAAPKPARSRLSPTQIFDLRTKCQAIIDKDVEDSAIGIVGNALRADIKSHYNPITTTVRLNVEENQLVNVFGEFCVCIGSLKSA